MRRLPIWLVVVGVVIALLAAFVLLTVLHLDVAQMAAYASAVAAIAALFTARESNETARNATRALSYATKPTVTVEAFGGFMGEPAQYVIRNTSTHTISEMVVSWVGRDGERGRDVLQEFRGLSRPGALPRDMHQIQINAGTATGSDTITIDYRGPLGPTKWRMTATWEFHFHSDGETSGGSRGASIVEVELK